MPAGLHRHRVTDGDRRPRQDDRVEDQNIDDVNDDGIDESTESDALETVGAEDGEA